jgi:hypothetical protein
MVLESIFSDFKKLETPADKVQFLESLKKLNLSYDIKYDNLINYYLAQPEKAEEDE